MGREFCIHQSWDGTGKWEGRGNGRGREIAFISRGTGRGREVGRDADGTDERNAEVRVPRRGAVLPSPLLSIPCSLEVMGRMHRTTEAAAAAAADGG